MNQKINAADHLVEHYTKLSDLKSDFRNYNLFRLLSLIVKGKTVVDIGCGVASLAGILADQGKKVIGIEPNEDLRALANKINPKVIIVAGQAEDIKNLVAEPVDTVLMVDVLEHIEDDVEQVKKIRAILKTGGEFIFVVPAHRFLYGERDRKMGHYRRYSLKMLQNIFNDNGFHLESLRHWNALGFLPYLISEKVFHKPFNSKLRGKTRVNGLELIIQRGLNLWLGLVENKLDLGFGLSIIGVAKKDS